jgi:hypothetical protein
MMIELREAEIFEGQVAQALDSLIGGERAAVDPVEKFADGFGVHGALTLILSMGSSEV